MKKIILTILPPHLIRIGAYGTKVYSILIRCGGLLGILPKIKKSLAGERSFSVDPTRFALVSLLVNGSMLLHTPQARIHAININKKTRFFKKVLLQQAGNACNIQAYRHLI